MNYSKRHGEILKLLQEEGTITIARLAEKLGVSLETVRRDVKPLTSDGSVLKMHGAIGLPSMVGEAPFERRMREQADAKRAIAKLVAATIGDGESVMLDTGTTTSFLARELLNHRRLTVVTNSSDIARTLATVNGNKVYMAGGELRSDSGAAFGVSAIEFVSRFSVNHAVITAGAIDVEHGVMDYVLEEAEFARVVLTRGTRTLVVTDHTKFGRQGLVQVCGFDAFGELATDIPRRATSPPRSRRQARSCSSPKRRARRSRVPSWPSPSGSCNISSPSPSREPCRAPRRTCPSRSPRSPRRSRNWRAISASTLFERHPRGLNITHKGHQFLRHATKILADVSDARRTFFDGREERPPGACNSASPRWSPAMCCRTCSRDTGARIPRSRSRRSRTMATTSSICSSAASSTSRSWSPPTCATAWRCSRKFWRFRPIGCGCRSATAWPAAEIINLGDIAAEPLIMLTVDEIEENTGKLLNALGARPHVAFRTRSVEAVRSLVATGAGVALLPDLVYRPWSLEGDRIESRDISGSLPVVQVGMVWRRGSGLPQAARDFIGIAQAQRTVRQRV